MLETGSQVSGRPFVVCLLVSSEDSGSDVTRNIEMHLSRWDTAPPCTKLIAVFSVASKSVGTRFIQAVQEPRDNDVDTVAGQRLDGGPNLPLAPDRFTVTRWLQVPLRCCASRTETCMHQNRAPNWGISVQMVSAVLHCAAAHQCATAGDMLENWLDKTGSVDD